MKKKGQTEIERRILSRLRKEMNKPRLSKSVRNGLSAIDASIAEKSTVRPAQA